ncbi:glutathione S-transferase N-terminal domain-containing protein [Candidatus Thioglobus sp.]|jgi:glutaredoxin|uniref:glutathione S-transferase N-terminal domain-containing protein n=1 Tax=unclassified Candidatus Pseudothioglobus TaxID=3072908 RepID=UPI002334463D|nr:glutathione S-transferase N-terminal domain-containing protein [Candidatus Thioglobus sp.]MDB9788395.1 glutathione S-transferase N-terminal domain-containing protein [Candidatus Thioglobus sp.]MDB9951592.1 glutathione S-transferase N-terminal domain-containing protein [Candidatus Thioglobus sp.]MDC1447778.1 glutathione S-transferase N-terminal domain-containing protein [Candidatus Thioglobus sp.]MDC1450085.1 glutathione S-transferase N-terminal domain-containing protein [Candidatus Thioglobu|tara:strand:- start:475 stop:846 length:372 start_codon:yes stop_codon:yes gene_type:complete
MRFFLRLLREGSGRVLILIDWLFKPSVVKRNDEEQAKVDQETKILKLYQFYACPFCVKTRRAIKRLNLKVETRDAQTAGKFRKELEISGGKIKVPCLKLEGAGEATWIYESNDIIKYLDERFS